MNPLTLTVLACCLLLGCVDRSAPGLAEDEGQRTSTPQDSCVVGCIEERRAEAMGWQTIEAQCEAACAESRADGARSAEETP